MYVVWGFTRVIERWESWEKVWIMSPRALHKNPLHNVKSFVSKTVNCTMSANNVRHCLQWNHGGKFAVCLICGLLFKLCFIAFPGFFVCTFMTKYICLQFVFKLAYKKHFKKIFYTGKCRPMQHSFYAHIYNITIQDKKKRAFPKIAPFSMITLLLTYALWCTLEWYICQQQIN